MNSHPTDHDKWATRRARLLMSCLGLILVPLDGLAKDMPRITQKGDIEIWDEQYLHRAPKGWKVPENYHESFGKHGGIPNEIRFGRFGVLSGRILYTSWRPVVPLTNEQYAEGKVKLLDSHTSEVLTAEFEVKHDYVTFLISGGNMPGEACLNLLVDGKVVRSATGTGQDVLMPAAFDVKEFKGKKARIQALDTSKDPFGYITVDCVYQSTGPKGAKMVISQPLVQKQEAGSVKTVSGTAVGKVELAGGALTVAGEAVDLTKVIELDTGVAALPSDAGSRVLLSNGDILAGEITGLTDVALNLTQSTLGELELKLGNISQAIFMPGATVKAKPGTLVQIDNRLIPGKLKWIREENIAIDCALGLVPLPRTRVRSFVFTETKVVAGAANRVVFADGSVLSGQLAVNDKGLTLKHLLLGDLVLELKQVALITRNLSKVSPLTEIKCEVVKRVGPIPPPAPEVISAASGKAIRMFPGTVTRYTLPDATHPRRLRAQLVSLSGAKVGVKVTVRVNGKPTLFTIDPGAAPQPVDLDLGSVKVLEIQVDSSQAIAFPSGVEWHNSLIIETNAS